MMAAWRLRCLPVLLLVHCVMVSAADASSVEGTNTGGGGASSSPRGGGQDRRNAANKHRRSTTTAPDPHDPSITTSVADGQHDPMLVPWVEPEADERAGHGGNRVKATRRTVHGGKTKTRKNGTDGGHVDVTMETGFSTTDTLLLATNHVIASDVVTASYGAEDGSKRLKPNGGRSSTVTRTLTGEEAAEPRQKTTDASNPQRSHRVKTATTPTTTSLMTTTVTTIAIPSTTTTKLLVRKQSTTARSLPQGGRSSLSTRYSNRTTPHQGSTRGEGCSSSCEMHRCETVEAEMCQGRVVKDRCNCCPVCFVEPRSTDESREDDVTTRKTSHHPSNACDGMQCPKHKVCILNIQGIPMCRCPNIYSCKGIERNPMCAENGVTYKNKCFLKVEECTIGRRIHVYHRGSCRIKPTTTQLDSPVVMSKTTRLDSDHRTQQATHQRKGSGKNDQWRQPATSDKTKYTKLRKRAGNKSQFS